MIRSALPQKNFGQKISEDWTRVRGADKVSSRAVNSSGQSLFNTPYKQTIQSAAHLEETRGGDSQRLMFPFFAASAICFLFTYNMQTCKPGM